MEKMLKILKILTIICIFLLFIIIFGSISWEVLKEIQQSNFKIEVYSFAGLLNNIMYNNYKWALFSSKIIFIIVNIVVLVGLYMSWIQFQKNIDSSNKEDTNSANKKNEEQHQIEISNKSIKITSNVIGLIILVISLVFYFLYLHYVYPIELQKIIS